MGYDGEKGNFLPILTGKINQLASLYIDKFKACIKKQGVVYIRQQAA